MMMMTTTMSRLVFRAASTSHTTTTTNKNISNKTTKINIDRRKVLGLFGVGLSSISSSPNNNNNKIAFAAKASSGEQQKNAISQVLKDPQWPPIYPFTTKDMGRYDESADSFFYEQPRLVKHIDDQAIDALTKYYSEVFKTVEKPKVLDICSSWISHYPSDVEFSRCAGTGMNEDELLKNPRFTEKPTVVDLNETPKLPYDDNSFDFVTNAVSVDYLTKPLEVMQEVRRVLKPGGRAIMSFSNRCFPTKAVSIWTATGDLDHIWIVGAYYHFANGFDPPEGIDISPNPGRSDPMYVVTAVKSV
jgi:SAM-dependent methyltransferase